MDEVTKVLSSPAVRTGLKLVAPEIGLGIDLVLTIANSLSRKSTATTIIKIIDRQLASMLKELSTTKSRPRRKELEIRIHTLLGVMMEIS